MPDLTHDQLLLILAIALAPGLLQAVVNRQVHFIWLAAAMLAGVSVVLAW